MQKRKKESEKLRQAHQVTEKIVNQIEKLEQNTFYNLDESTEDLTRIRLQENNHRQISQILEQIITNLVLVRNLLRDVKLEDISDTETESKIINYLERIEDSIEHFTRNNIHIDRQMGNAIISILREISDLLKENNGILKTIEGKVGFTWFAWIMTILGMMIGGFLVQFALPWLFDLNPPPEVTKSPTLVPDYTEVVQTGTATPYIATCEPCNQQTTAELCPTEDNLVVEFACPAEVTDGAIIQNNESARVNLSVQVPARGVQTLNIVHPDYLTLTNKGNPQEIQDLENDIGGKADRTYLLSAGRNSFEFILDNEANESRNELPLDMELEVSNLLCVKMAKSDVTDSVTIFDSEAGFDTTHSLPGDTPVFITDRTILRSQILVPVTGNPAIRGWINNSDLINQGDNNGFRLYPDCELLTNQ